METFFLRGFRIALILNLFLFLLQTGCASTAELNQKSDYNIAKAHLKGGSYHASLVAYPKLERSGFIHITEQSWLKLLDSDPMEFSKIKDMGNQLSEKDIVILSKEASHFFYKKTEEGYFPAEHEVIVFHLISCMSLLQQKKNEQAWVEAKKAAFYLQDDFVSHTGAFDDPYLRVWLASLWVALDEWSFAQVDLRRAAELSKDYIWAKELAQEDQAPKTWIVGFQGIGPEVEWDPHGFQQHWTGRGSLKFVFPKHSTAQLKIGTKVLNTQKIENSSEMYIRHEKRNKEIRETLETSDYMMKSSSLHLSAGAAKGMAKVANGTLKIAGLAVGGAIIAGTIYLLSQAEGASGTGELAALGIGLGVGSFKTFSNAGTEIDDDVSKSVDESLESALDISKTYRFVRFIPDVMTIATEASPPLGPVRMLLPEDQKESSPFLVVPTRAGSVQFLFQPL